MKPIIPIAMKPIIHSVFQTRKSRGRRARLAGRPPYRPACQSQSVRHAISRLKNVVDNPLDYLRAGQGGMSTAATGEKGGRTSPASTSASLQQPQQRQQRIQGGLSSSWLLTRASNLRNHCNVSRIGVDHSHVGTVLKIDS